MGASMPPDPVAHYLKTYGAPADDTSTPAVPHDPVAHYLNTYKPAPASAAAPRSTFMNAVNTFDDALTLGYGQKFDAALSALGDKITGRDSFRHSYDKNFAADKAGRDAFAQQHPAGAVVTGAVGGALPVLAAAPFAAPGEIANGLSLAQRTLAAAKAGAGFGAAGAMGHTNAQDTGDVIGAAVKGGVVGGLVGAGSVPAAQLIGAAAQKLGRGVGSAMSRVSAGNDLTAPASTGAEQPIDRASQLLLQRMDRAGIAPSDAVYRAQGLPEGKPVSVMEIADDKSQPLRELGKWVARTPSGGAADLRAAITQRAEPLSSAQRVLGDVSEAMGAPRTNLVDQAKVLKGQQLAAAKPFYDAAFGEGTPPVPLDAKVGDGPTLAELLKRPSIKGAVRFHNDIAAERGEPSLSLPSGESAQPRTPPTADDVALYQRLSKMNGANEDATTKAMQQMGYTADGIAALKGTAPAELQGVPLKTLQQLKFKLDDALGFAKTRGTLPDGTPATKAKLGAVNDTRRALLDIMNQHAPDFAKGNESWAGDAAIQNAGDEGRSFLNRDFDELQSEYPKMGAGEQQQHNVAAVSGPLRDRIYNSAATDRAKFLTNPDIQERMSVVTPPDRVQGLMRNVGTEHEIALTNQQLLNGSDTFSNFANEADVGGGKVASGVLRGLVSGRPRSAFRAIVGGVVQPTVDRVVHGINEQTANALAPKLSAGMMSREELIAMLNDLANKHAALQRFRGTPPMIGTNAGVSVGSLMPGKKEY